jgi:hypothetical protein
VLVTCGPLTAESPHSMTLQSVWESRERKGAASRDRDFNASEKPEWRVGGRVDRRFSSGVRVRKGKSEKRESGREVGRKKE